MPNLTFTLLSYSNSCWLPTKVGSTKHSHVFPFSYHSQHDQKIVNWISYIFSIFQSSLLCLCTQMNASVSSMKSLSLLLLYSLLNPCKMLLSQFACYPSLLKLCTVTDQKLLGEENFVLQIFYSPLPCHDNLCKVLKYWLNWKANYRSKTIL